MILNIIVIFICKITVVTMSNKDYQDDKKFNLLGLTQYGDMLVRTEKCNYEMDRCLNPKKYIIITKYYDGLSAYCEKEFIACLQSAKVANQIRFRSDI